ncbi:MAG: CRISPR-associated protein Cas5 [Candidatus Hadarchaeum sp.]|uniref:CRISPR-associated protein Cas5 n=1 Tax=Candidatus Hadarchaeum sp. TaxID=2883567 RepID=UPI00316CD77C
MKAIVVRVDFFEAHFRVHRTKCAALTYPAPLPTSVAGIFGALCGWNRRFDGPPEEAKGLLFGAKILSHKGICVEYATYKEIPKKVRGVASLAIIDEPSYLIAMAGKGVENWYGPLASGSFCYLPYGGQSWFFPKDIKGVRLEEVKEAKEIENYAPKELVKGINLSKTTSIHILPVIHKFSTDETFYFLEGGGKLILNQKIPFVDGIGLYSLDDFHWVVG